MHEESLIRRVKKLTEDYSFTQPFSNYLREYFRSHPEMGARDRRETREWCFNSLRIGMNLDDIPFEKRLAAACFLCSSSSYPSLSYLLKTHSDFSETDLEKSIKEKIEIVSKYYPSFSTENIFPMHQLLSPQIRKQEWLISFLKKPRVWIRMREKFTDVIINELNEMKISFLPDDDPLILSFLPEAALDKTNSFQKGYFEIQDKFSQLTRDFFQPGKNEYWWDACAGAGGKSLLLMEQSDDTKIFASDIRDTILKNYSDRMKKAGHRNFETKVLNLISNSSVDFKNKFDGIIADVPCSGSGTWSRSPEWLQQNLEEKLTQFFIPLQRNIISSVLPSLKKDFPLIYITCSVFKKENEENVEFFINNFPLKLEKTTYLQGYESGGDTFFVARFKKLS